MYAVLLTPSPWARCRSVSTRAGVPSTIRRSTSTTCRREKTMPFVAVNVLRHCLQMNRWSLREWTPILPWPVWPLAGHARLWQKTVVGSMMILLALLGNMPREVCLDPNGIKLSSSTLLYQDFTGFTPWFCEERIRFGPAFDGTRLNAARTVGIDDQGRERFPRTRRAEPPQGINEADPLQGHALPLRRGQHHHADEVVDEREDGQLLQDPDEALAVQHLKAHRLFEVPEIALALPDATYKNDLVSPQVLASGAEQPEGSTQKGERTACPPLLP